MIKNKLKICPPLDICGLEFKLSPHLHFDKRCNPMASIFDYVTYVYFNDKKPIFAVTGFTKTYSIN